MRRHELDDLDLPFGKALVHKAVQSEDRGGRALEVEEDERKALR